MKNIRLTQSLKLLAASALFSFAASSFAGTTWTPATWIPGDVPKNAAETCGVGSTAATSCGSSGGVTLTGQAFSNNGADKGTGATFASAALWDYGSDHLGVVSSAESKDSSPNHSMDNNGSTDLISLKFGSSVALNNVKTGWAQGDSDMSVLAYLGSASDYSILGKSIAQLLADGWKLVANIDGTGTATGGSYNFNAGNAVSSSWWIVSAYNAAYSGSKATDATTGLDGGDDYTKILSVAGNIKTSNVPEPGSLALMGAAFCAALGARRRSAAKAKTKSISLTA